MSTKTPEELAEAWHPSRPDDDNFDNGMRTGYAIALKEHVLSAGAVTREEVSEPVAWMNEDGEVVPNATIVIWKISAPHAAFRYPIPLYAHPPLAAKVEPRDHPQEGEGEQGKEVGPWMYAPVTDEEAKFHAQNFAAFQLPDGDVDFSEIDYETFLRALKYIAESTNLFRAPPPTPS